MRLTPKQAEALEHRLDVDIDWCDMFTDWIDTGRLTVKEFEESVDILWRQVRARRINPSEWNRATPHALAEMVDGSTYLACRRGDPSYGGALRTMKSLEAAISTLVGFSVEARRS